MKKLLLLTLAFSSLSYAADVHVNHFNFDYTAPHGEGRADEVFVTVDKVEKDFKVVLQGTENRELEFKNAPGFLADAETMTMKDFNFHLTDALDLSMASGAFNSEKSELGLTDMSLSCVKASLEGCLENLLFKAGRFTSNDTKVKSMNFKMTAGAFNFTADYSGKVKGNGSMSYDKTTSVLAIKISEVKFSILNITSKVFAELKKKESEKIKVKQPYIYITLK
jgi:hypothetical protein